MYFIEINAKRVHSNLAYRYFMSNFKLGEYHHFRYTINQPIDIIVQDIIKHTKSQTPIFIFSAYVWNIVYAKRIAHVLKGVYPKSILIVGGPEVSFFDYKWLDNSPFDILLKGEGEAFYKRLSRMDQKQRIRYLIDSQPVISPKVIALDDLGIGYNDAALKDEYIIYYESSRGCPYNCSYCISSTTKGVRVKSRDVVMRELDVFLKAKVPVVKFIDRTFNAPVNRAIDIMAYLIANDNDVSTFHFELSPNLINDALVEVVKQARPSLFQFEVGLQSAKKATLDAVGRTFDALDWTMVKKLVNTGAHVHLDLIAGLPYETFDDFRQSFNAVIKLKPDHFQVGVLKLLQGSNLRAQAEKFDYIYDPLPPYTFYQNHVLTAKEQTQLLALEEGTERVYNDGTFDYYIKFLYAYQIKLFDYLIDVGSACLDKKARGYKLGKSSIAEIALDALNNEKLGLLATEVIVADFFMNNVKLTGDLKTFRTAITPELSEAIYQQQISIHPSYSSKRRKDVLKSIKVIKIAIDLISFKPQDAPIYYYKFADDSKVYRL